MYSWWLTRTYIGGKRDRSSPRFLVDLKMLFWVLQRDCRLVEKIHDKSANEIPFTPPVVVHVGDERTTPRRQSPRLPGSRRQSQGSDVQGGKAREEEEEDGKGETSHSIQSSLRQRRRHFRQKEGTQLQLLGNENFDTDTDSTGRGRERGRGERTVLGRDLVSFCAWKILSAYFELEIFVRI